MLYNEFLAGTGAIDNQASYDEYKRVEVIYMESEHCTKEDAYRMAKVETEEQHEARMKAERKTELAWVKENVISAAAFVRGMSEKANYIGRNYVWMSDCGNLFELKLVHEINCGSVMLYEFWCNGKKLNIEDTCQYRLLPSAEFQSYRADWYNKDLKELQELFGYIA